MEMIKVKIETDICEEIEIPDKLLRAFEKESEMTIKSEKDFEDSDLWLDFKLFCREYVDKNEGKLVDEDIARFLCNMITCFVPDEGGYPVEDVCVFEIEGKTYGVIAFSWTPFLDEKEHLTMIAYRVKK